MTVEVREDIERIFVVDKVPRGCDLLYDLGGTDCVLDRMRPTMIHMAPPWNEGVLLMDVWRAEIVNAILSVKEAADPLRPFTLMRCHEEMYGRALALDSLLVNTEMIPLLGKVGEPWLGKAVRLFSHFDVPMGEVYGFAEPEFVGVVPIQAGVPGIALTNQNGIVWGTFRERRT
jgi:hypothetical protein